MKAKFNKTNKNVGWAQYTWNPVTGCLGPKGDGKHCTYCYAKAMADRFYQDFRPVLHADRIDAPENTPLPKKGNNRVFVCSMGELFGPWIPFEWIDEIFGSVRANPQWTFLFLTKFPDRLLGLDWPANAWIGATVDRQIRVSRTVHVFARLKEMKLNNKLFLSCEPLLEQITFYPKTWDYIDWLLIGALSKGRVKVQPKNSWVEYLLFRARGNAIPVWFKDNLIYRPQEVPNCA